MKNIHLQLRNLIGQIESAMIQVVCTPILFFRSVVLSMEYRERVCMLHCGT